MARNEDSILNKILDLFSSVMKKLLTQIIHKNSIENAIKTAHRVDLTSLGFKWKREGIKSIKRRLKYLAGILQSKIVFLKS